MNTDQDNNVTRVAFKAPNIKNAYIWIKGTAPLVIHAFGAKGREMMRAKQVEGSTAKSKKQREAKDFDALFNDARHISFEGWDGIPASAFRNACIRACSLVGYKMTLAKMSIFVQADGYDRVSGIPLVKIIGDSPRKLESVVRLATGVCDINSRPQWLEWGCCLRVSYDGDQFTATDIMNLLNRAGAQVGICEGRPMSTNSCGMGWGTFRVSDEKEVMALAKKGAKK